MLPSSSPPSPAPAGIQRQNGFPGRPDTMSTHHPSLPYSPSSHIIFHLDLAFFIPRLVGNDGFLSVPIGWDSEHSTSSDGTILAMAGSRCNAFRLPPRQPAGTRANAWASSGAPPSVAPGSRTSGNPAMLLQKPPRHFRGCGILPRHGGGREEGRREEGNYMNISNAASGTQMVLRERKQH